jgi:bifunctional UDP-N-acetylglucosamine pyrophosphorylase / glucosamine-1-phosphate N-acetyltransferase
MKSSSPPLSIAILAAGQGKRMRSDLPKVLHPLAGTPLLAHVLAAARSLDPRAIAVVVGHGAAEVRARLEAPDLAWALQEQQLGTGHAVLQALPLLPPEGIVLVLYGDMPLVQAATMRALVEATGGDSLAILTMVGDVPKGYGRIVRDAQGRVERIVEEKDATAQDLQSREANVGLIAAPFAKLARWLAALGKDNAQGEYYLTDIVAAAHAQGEAVNVCHPAGPNERLGVNSKSNLAHVERLLQSDRAKQLLDAGVTLADPARLDIRGELACGRDVSIDVNCIFEGRVALADGVRVGANCILRDVTVGTGTDVRPFSLIEEATIGANARIGPYARIRPGTTLADEVHVGNFVEVKASALGRASKANHLSYVGDATVGANVNIGAGTITCNYDGANKHRTVIEDDVHIGSDVQLVAPVTIGRGATIGAGATITKDVPAGELALTEKKQVTRPGWKRPVKR